MYQGGKISLYQISKSEYDATSHNLTHSIKSLILSANILLCRSWVRIKESEVVATKHPWQLKTFETSGDSTLGFSAAQMERRIVQVSKIPVKQNICYSRFFLASNIEVLRKWTFFTTEVSWRWQNFMSHETRDLAETTESCQLCITDLFQNKSVAYF